MATVRAISSPQQFTHTAPSMSENLRHRGATTGASEARNADMKRSGGLTLQSMSTASPQQTGHVMKLHMSPICAMLPYFLQKWIMTLWFLSFLRPSWKPRYLILLGSFLYKFQDDQSPYQKPKGAPIPIDQVEVRLVGANEDSVVALCQHILVGYTTVVCISTMRKRSYYACNTREDALTWVNSIREAQHESVTRSMGHAARDSYPQKWTYFDSLGSSLVTSTDRIRHRIEQSNLRELEMIHLTDGAAPLGFFG